MRRKDRMKLVRGLLLTVTTLCSAALFYAAGDSAVKTFAGGGGQAVYASQGPLAGLTVAVDAGHEEQLLEG